MAAFTLFTLFPCLLGAAVPGGVTLKRDWKQYDRLARQDLPGDEMSQLETIMDKAMARRLHVDYYEAAVRYRDRRISRSWKEGDAAGKELTDRIMAFGMPSLTVYHYSQTDMGLLPDYVALHADELRKACTPAFYASHRPWTEVSAFLTFRNDLEYAAWLAMSWGDNGRMASLLETEYAGRYPESALLEYRRAYEAGKPEIESFAARYHGRGAAILAEDWLLRDKVGRLTSSDTTSCESLLALRDECLAFRTRVKEMCRKEKWLKRGSLTAADDGVGRLTAKSVGARVENNVVKASFVNVPYAEVILSDGRKVVYREKLVNDRRSFYKPDTLSLALPPIDDGRYVLRLRANGADPVELEYNKASLSVAVRRHEGTLYLYVADFMTGRPAEKVDVTVRKEGHDEVYAEASGVHLDGFTPLPESIAASLKEKEQYTMTCSYRDADGMLHKSRAINLYADGGFIWSSEPETVTRAQVLMGSGACHPGDTVRFKVIAYRGDIYSSLRTFAEGETLEVSITGARDYKSEFRITTNDFGSAEGEAVIPEDAEGGMYRVSVRTGNMHLGDAAFQVDEYVLPTYEIRFADDDCFWFKGDTVTVRGTVLSYSGHALTSASLTYKCGRSAGKAEIAEDGSFSISFVPESSYTRCEIKVTDATGETCKASRDVVLCRDSNGTDFHLDGPFSEDSRGQYSMVDVPEPELSFRWGTDRLNGALTAPVSYRVTHDGIEVCKGKVSMGEAFHLRFTGKSCLYDIEATVGVEDQKGIIHEHRETFHVLYLADDADVVDAPVENILRCVDGGDVVAQFGAGLGDVWAIAELWGCDHRLLHEEKIHLAGGRGAEGSLKRLDWKYREDWPEVVELRILYFRNGRFYNLQHTFTRPRGRLAMPVEFSRFADKTLPGNGYQFAVRALPQSECLVAVYDAATDKIWPNRWGSVALRLHPSYSGRLDDMCGSFDSEMPARIMYKAAKSSGVRVRGVANMMDSFSVVEEECAPLMCDKAVSNSAAAMESGALQDVDVRSEYADVLAFEPFLRTGDDGEVTFTVNTSDKLSTYHVSVFAHDRDMHNGMVVRDMTVTVPVKVSLVQPRLLYEGDRYVLHATVSNSSAQELDGIFGIDAYDGASWKDTPVLSHTLGKAHVPAKGSAELSFPLGKIPHCGSGVLGLKVSFAARDTDGLNVSDGMFVTVPVEAPEQEITEAHSALLRSDADRRHLTDSLMSQFSNGLASATVTDEILISDQLRKVLEQSSDTEAEDAVALSSAMTFRMLASHLKGETPDAGRYADALLALQGPDGGFAWLGGMRQSPLVTAVVLERLARLRSLGILPSGFTDGVISSAVKYLDSSYFSAEKPVYWRPSLSQGQYFYVRSLYPEVPMGEKLASHMKGEDRDYLTPSGDYAGRCIFHKARRIRTIANLQSSEAGVSLAKSWGVKLLTSRRLDKTLERDLASLIQYAVAHQSGGVFYPNAVMPWRGLMESELYAHSFLCDLFRDIEKAYPEHAAEASEISEGIRLWIMVQKETQKWSADPAFAEAVASVMDGSEDLMETRVLVLRRSVRIPFSQVRKSGNGMSVSTSYSVKRGDRWVVLKGGEVLPVGETVRATYSLWSEENRSFVRLTVPRPGCLVPVDQTSGYTWWNCYRRVRSGKTEYYWDAYPEEKTVITEDFHVSQEGMFAVPAAEIESAYAPHYRANAEAALPIRAELLN